MPLSQTESAKNSGHYHHVLFPDGGVVSVVAVYADGSVIEMATIGREGCTGVKAVFGAKQSSFRLLVQIPDHWPAHRRNHRRAPLG